MSSMSGIVGKLSCQNFDCETMRREERGSKVKTCGGGDALVPSGEPPET